ncbi:hypothetical protein BGP_5813 [Beggiatoa sp. PS]|nr:hypothetical protein BGP_5813 [Beggiatoa sp. PS]
MPRKIRGGKFNFSCIYNSLSLNPAKNSLHILLWCGFSTTYCGFSALYFFLAPGYSYPEKFCPAKNMIWNIVVNKIREIRRLK